MEAAAYWEAKASSFRANRRVGGRVHLESLGALIASGPGVSRSLHWVTIAPAGAAPGRAGARASGGLQLVLDVLDLASHHIHLRVVDFHRGYHHLARLGEVLLESRRRLLLVREKPVLHVLRHGLLQVVDGVRVRSPGVELVVNLGHLLNGAELELLDVRVGLLLDFLQVRDQGLTIGAHHTLGLLELFTNFFL